MTMSTIEADDQTPQENYEIEKLVHKQRQLKPIIAVSF